MNKKLKTFMIFLGVLLVVFVGALTYIVITERGIAFQGVYYNHIKEHPSEMTQAERFESDFEFLFEEIRDNYVNLRYKEELLQINWDELYIEYKQMINSINTEKEFYLLCNRFINELKDGHTNFTVLDDNVEWFNDSVKNLMRVRIIEDKGIIVAAKPTLDILGGEIVSINDMEFLDIVDKVAKYFSPSNHKTVARNNVIMRNQFWDYFHFFYDTYPEKLMLKIEMPNEENLTLTIDTQEDYKATSMSSIQNINFGFRESHLPTYRVLPNNIGYINIPTFVGSRREIGNEFDSIVKRFKDKDVQV